ncbi:MAG: FAD-dependent oxidoreductase [Cyanobacteria bacterium REEB67]|nr:FAD-dependent oxidoreductase [Cyanobacteria bacterium REEB67]
MKFSSAPCLNEAAPLTRRLIPWWSDLSEAAQAALQIPALADGDIFSEKFDLIVVGAGIAGLSATLAAAKLGLSVLCLEAGSTIGLGATGRNAGILCAGINMPITEAPQGGESGQLWLATAQALSETALAAKQLGSLIRLTQRGGLGLATSKTAVKRLQQEAKARTAAGLNAHMLGVSEVKKMSDGRLNLEAVQAAICYPDEGNIQPLTLLAQTAADARALGAQIVGGASVVSCEENKNAAATWRVKLSTGQTLHAPTLIKAVGPTAAPTARIYALSFAVDLPESFPLFWDAAPYIYYDFRPGNGRLTTSGGRYARVGEDRATDLRYHARMAAATTTWLPELRGHTPEYTWAVDLEVASDLVPHLTPLGREKRAYAIDGLGALGVMPGVVLARQAASKLAQKLKTK